MAKDRYADFRALSRDEQRVQLYALANACVDGAPPRLARWIEIYLEDE